MGFNNEEYVEEMLYIAHEDGYGDKLLDEVRKMREDGIKLRTVDLYNEALKRINGQETR